MSYTKGPWAYKLTPNDVDFVGEIVGSLGEGIAAIYCGDGKADADAKLMGAAPDLLEALQEMVQYFDYMLKDPQFPAYRKAKEAINKALNK